ncbi:MAG TPA: 50S ribosomal protein L25 [Verrucomicrobiae bacterium]|nr:50S ribosomal protein L25 [Verrucomicrobiae bacterium]
MSSDTIVVELQKREVIRKGLAGLRAEGSIPAVIHNHGKESIHVMGDFRMLTKAYSAAGKHHPVELTVDGKKHLALIKDVDFDPARHQMRHVVFQAIRQNEKTTADIPVVLAGDEIPAERKSLLVLTQLDTVQVEALPRDLPDELTVDGTKLQEVGDHLYVSDITAPAGVTILTDPEASIAVVEMPKDQAAEADASAASLADDAGTTGTDDDAEQTEEATEGDEKPAEKTEQ